MTACLSSKVVESKKVSQIYVPDIFQEGPTDSFTETLFRLVRLSKSKLKTTVKRNMFSILCVVH